MNDQAAGLRKSEPTAVKVVAVTSGKGGVGKTSTAVNLALALVRSGRKVMLLDADLGLANIDIMLGMQPGWNLSHVLKGECELADIVVQISPGLELVPGASGVAEMASLSVAEHAGLIHAFEELTSELDVLIVDTSAGISSGVVQFAGAAHEVLVVVCDEPASITDAYALIKVLSRDHGMTRLHVLANMVRNARHAEDLFSKIDRVAERFLDVSLDLVGAIPYDESLRRAIQQQQGVVDRYPGSPSASAYMRLAERVDAWPTRLSEGGRVGFFVERLLASSTPRVAAR